MIAVIKIGGHQAIVKVGEKINVDKIDKKEGEKISFDVFLVSEENGDNFQIGAPFLENMMVEAKIIEHGRYPKINVFKMKPRKRYRRTYGHKQDFTCIEIIKIGEGKAKPVISKKTEEKVEIKKLEKKEEPKKTTKKIETKTTEKKVVTKKTTTKKAAPKKVVTKKTTTKKASVKKPVEKKVETK